MDKIDIEMLRLLQEDSRMTVSQLSKQLALSRPSVTERMHRLQEKGIIEEFTARVSPAAIGRATIIFIQLSELKITPQEFEKRIKEEKDIIECHRVTGQTSYFIKAAVSKIEGLGMLVDRLIPFGNINTSIVLASPIPYRHLLPEQE
ncbi:Lrp/AsnC family transcriptional regulator [Alkalicoccus daliensis]|uniref:Lrp/AsnC family transcriptional regulator, leucine-responsive regulatory protein n=1 Tax=Alkalicoccus daliensis TaxID=745820 RepID=A0A1H0FUB5_9BACI|nr:Lrp/AsnC family transcriptional regulator [Alkalicoccus daliensis]SDN98174.1 Lrp/AsnC family transcriptional regulator, leucine-responsive regulatory protein [Alkalicoccus daliensis]